MLSFNGSHFLDFDLSVGLNALRMDLPLPGQTPLRQFLSRYAVEAPHPRRVAEALAELWAAPVAGFERRLKDISALATQMPLGRLARDVVSAELSNEADPRALLSVVEEFGNKALEVDAAQIVDMVGRMDSGDLERLLSLSANAPDETLGAKVFEASLRGCDPDRLADAASQKTRAAMLHLRPELLTVRRFWPADDSERASIIRECEMRPELGELWELFGKNIGAIAARTLLELAAAPPSTMLMSLLSSGSEDVSSEIAQHVVADPSALQGVLKAPQQVSISVLDRLASAQVARNKRPASELSWCKTVEHHDEWQLSPNTLIVSYLASLGEATGPHGLNCARQVYDPLMLLVRRHRLTPAQERYLDSMLSSKVRGYGLTNKVRESALAQWPPRGAKAGALSVSNEGDHVRDLVDGAISRFGPAAIRGTVNDPALRPGVRTYIKRRLDSAAKNKSWWF
jgi:hypothetical protein